MKLRQRFGKWLILRGSLLVNPDFGKEGFNKIMYQGKEMKPDTTDAVVEAITEADKWQPIQHGNVVIAEPDIMRQFRRDHDQM